MLYSFSFNGIRKNYVYLDDDDNQFTASPPISRKLLTIPGMHGAYLENTEIQPRTIKKKIFFHADSRENLRKLEEEIQGWLFTEEPAELIFDDEPDRIYYAVVDGTFDVSEFLNVGESTITFVCPDPYKYGPEQTINFINSTTVDNEETVDAKPIIELTATQKVTFAMISDGTNYNMVGRPASVNEQVIDTKTALINENGETINTWTTAPPEMEGGSQGTIGYDGAGITALSYGTGTGYHGPSIVKEVPVTQDFEVELRGQLLTNNQNQTGRFGFFLFDDQMREIAFMTACDNTANVNQKLAEARLGEFISVGKNYLISSNNYLKKWDNFPALLRLTRIGKSFTFYVARIQGDGSHMEPLTVRWNDTSSQYNGKLKYVGIFIDKYGTTASPHTNRIDYIKAWGLTKETTDQIPYIAQPGDVFLFDHVNNQILLNGESIKSLKDFGGTYFTLNTGQTVLTVLPDNAFNAKIKFRPRYR